MRGSNSTERFGSVTLGAETGTDPVVRAGADNLKVSLGAEKVDMLNYEKLTY